MSIAKRSVAEFLGTFWLVFAGCGSAVLAAGTPAGGIGWLGVALAFGLTVVTMAYAVGHISGAVLAGLAHRFLSPPAGPQRDRIGKPEAATSVDRRDDTKT
jgi:hypothetical protein